MASESAAPPPPTGGNLKYGIIGVVLILAAVGLWFGMQSCEGDGGDPTAQVNQAPDAGPPAPPPPDPDLIMPDELPDAGGPVDAGGPRIRYVTRYAGGGGGAFNCSGDIDAARAAAAMRSRQLQFRNCYERRLKVNQTLSGQVQLQVRVGRDGAVTGVRTGGSLRDPQVLSCVRNIAQRIRFPRPTGGCAVVGQPFDFTPRE